MNCKLIITFLVSAAFMTKGLCQPTPGTKQAEAVLIIGGIAHLGTGDVLENSAIGFRNGKID